MNISMRNCNVMYNDVVKSKRYSFPEKKPKPEKFDYEKMKTAATHENSAIRKQSKPMRFRRGSL
jgi:hypothetical protein